jgi:hypothetical protein
MKYRLQRAALALTCAALIGLTADQAGARFGGGLGTILKVGGIVLAVKVFGSDINKFVNTLLVQHGWAYDGATKVVPIVAIGQGGYVGAAQVQGAKSFVDDVKAVGQLDAKLGSVDGHLLLPLNTLTPTSVPHKVQGVGVSAIISFRI